MWIKTICFLIEALVKLNLSDDALDKYAMLDSINANVDGMNTSEGDLICFFCVVL